MKTSLKLYLTDPNSQVSCSYLVHVVQTQTQALRKSETSSSAPTEVITKKLTGPKSNFQKLPKKLLPLTSVLRILFAL